MVDQPINLLFSMSLQAAIWHCLNHYDYADATFLAERFFAEGKRAFTHPF